MQRFESILLALAAGSPGQGLIRQVLRGSHDLVMIVAEGEGGLKDAIFGSTSHHLIRNPIQPSVWTTLPGSITSSMKGIRLSAEEADGDDAPVRQPRIFSSLAGASVAI